MEFMDIVAMKKFGCCYWTYYREWCFSEEEKGIEDELEEIMGLAFEMGVGNRKQKENDEKIGNINKGSLCHFFQTKLLILERKCLIFEKKLLILKENC